jgi:secreted trypsin-like serine protease
VLKELDVPIIADSICSGTKSYGSLFQAASMLCAGFLEGGRDSCFGDSGGPLYASIDGDGVRLIGIVSTGISCAKPDLPGIYTRVAEPEISSRIASMITEIEVLENFPVAFRGVDAVGSGAKLPGCSAASRDAARARAAFRSAVKRVNRTVRIVSRNQVRVRKASGDRKDAIRRLRDSRAKLRSAVRSLRKLRSISNRASASAQSACG